MTIRPPTWMIVLLAVQLALALAGLAAVAGLANAMSAHSVAFAHDDIPLLFPAIAVVLLGGLALAVWGQNHRTLSTILAFIPFPVAAALMTWVWW